MIWDIKPDGSFTIHTDISTLLMEGNGVYTIVVLAKIEGEFVTISNYSIFL